MKGKSLTLYSVLFLTGVQNGYPSTVTETTDVCLQELERLNKEIETVTHEVEQEQRRLSRYQTVQADCESTVQNISVLKTEFAGKRVDKRSYAQSSCMDLTKTHSRAKKYVVDNSKPRTDLEYDPLSNFSADLRSYSCSVKEQKVKNVQSLKQERDSAPCDQKKPVAKTQLPHSASPEPLDDSNEDGILIIDIPPSPDRKRRRPQKVNCVSGKSEDTVEEITELKTAPSLIDSPPLHLTNGEASTVVHKISNEYQSPLNENTECENTPLLTVIDLKSECQKETGQTGETQVESCPEPASLPTPTNNQDQSWNSLGVEEEDDTSQDKLPQCKPSLSTDEMNPLQPHDFHSKNSLFYDAQAANSPYRRAQNRGHDHWSPKQSASSSSVKPGSQKMSSEMPGQMQDKAIINKASSVRYEAQAEPPSGSRWIQTHHLSPTSVNSYVGETSSEPAEQLSVKADEEIIIISSSEEEELSYSDVDLSDSDPMEECYRIFMEANNEDNGKEEQPSMSVSQLMVL